jgi:hypothetical protein
MGLMKELNDLNNIYQEMYEVDEAMVVTNADKKAKTPAYLGLKAGKKGKDGKPLYKAADHLKDEVEVEFQPSDTVKKLIESGKFSKEEIWKIVEVEEETVKKSQTLDELKKSTLGSYIAKGSKDLADRRFDQGDSEKRKYEPDEADDKEDKKLDKREQGIARAAKKLSKEGYQRNPEKGEEEERKRNKKVPGERTPMPPRGDKRREDFERWYAANVR